MDEMGLGLVSWDKVGDEGMIGKLGDLGWEMLIGRIVLGGFG